MILIDPLHVHDCIVYGHSLVLYTCHVHMYRVARPHAVLKIQFIYTSTCTVLYVLYTYAYMHNYVQYLDF